MLSVLAYIIAITIDKYTFLFVCKKAVSWDLQNENAF